MVAPKLAVYNANQKTKMFERRSSTSLKRWVSRLVCDASRMLTDTKQGDATMEDTGIGVSCARKMLEAKDIVVETDHQMLATI